MEVLTDSSNGGGDTHVYSLLSMCMKEYFRDHLVGDAYLGLFFSEGVLAGPDKDASWVQSELREDARVAPDQCIVGSEFQLRG